MEIAETVRAGVIAPFIVDPVIIRSIISDRSGNIHSSGAIDIVSVPYAIEARVGEIDRGSARLKVGAIATECELIIE
jgi:hypothetical protein